ncbi:class I SAM-dependent methyltransferase [Catellatospora sichuanensis]|uniref:class I SAM-dependent methyltransferase n=1 Tax=Catellatospora sichuanensis TaxID=1969805 RepID=UPI001183D82D|nr:class I SAM-dependent methyltransferase [Catellatospora sichuanensis]
MDGQHHPDRRRRSEHQGGHAFDRDRSESYDRRAAALLRPFYRQVAAEIAATAPAGGHVADIGTGPGRMLHELARRRGDLRLSGVDSSPDMVAVAATAADRAGLAQRISLHTADVAALPFPDGGLDVASSTLSQHEWPRLEAAAVELARVLRPGGLLLVYDFRFLPVRPALAAYGRAPFTVQRSRLRLPWHPAALFTRLTLRRR